MSNGTVSATSCRNCKTNENFSLPSKSPLLKLNPVIVNGLLRVGGRLDRASVSFDLKHPIILPHTSHLTNLIVLYCHCITGHSGANMTLNQLLQRYWILRNTAVVRRVLNFCMLCRRRYEKPGAQKMADLPPSRLQIDTHPFAYCGIDYFGPLLVKQLRSQVKRYGCLFTCLTSRAIHIEVAMDLTTDAFINALRRFLSKKGPVLHFSDNGTNFVSAEKTLLVKPCTSGISTRLKIFSFKKKFNGVSILQMLATSAGCAAVVDEISFILINILFIFVSQALPQCCCFYCKL